MPFSWFKIDCSQIPLSRLSGCACKTLLALAAICSEDQTSRCSYDALCRSLSISRRSAIRSVKELEQAEVLQRCNLPGQTLIVRWKRGISVGRRVDPEHQPLGYRHEWSAPGGVSGGTASPG